MDAMAAKRSDCHISIDGFIDIHTHILPGLDDGPKDISASLALALRYQEMGIHRVIATPHFLPGTAWAPTSAHVLESVAKLNKEFHHNHIAIKILAGMEIAYHKKMEERILANSLLPLAHSGHFLVEPSFQGESDELLFSIGSLLNKGVKIILAHPERTESFQKSSKVLAQYVARGLKIQVNSGSLLGYFGEKCKQTAELFLRENLLHFIASDAHDTAKRAPLNSAEWQQLQATAQRTKMLAQCKRNIDEMFDSAGHARR